MASWTMTDPTKLYFINGVSCPVLFKAITLGIAPNLTVVAAVASKRIRVMGWMIQSAAAAQGSFNFSTSSGGLLFPVMAAPPSTALPFQAPIVPSGYFETETGDILQSTITIAQVVFFVNYVVYTP